MDKRKMMTTLAGMGLSVAAAMSGAFLVTPSEGDHPTTYIDPVGIVTDCYGHTGGDVKVGYKNTDQECLNKLAKDLYRAETEVESVVKVPLNNYQKAALISFDYNVGVGNLKKSTLAIKFNAGDYQGGCQELLQWVYAGKGSQRKKLAGLETRRQLEYQMCTGNYDVNQSSWYRTATIYISSLI
jgi:lysozyme